MANQQAEIQHQVSMANSILSGLNSVLLQGSLKNIPGAIVSGIGGVANLAM